MIFDDLKGLVLEWEYEGEGGWETLKKTKRTVIRCPRRRKQEGGTRCLSSWQPPPAPPATAQIQQPGEGSKKGLGMGLLRETTYHTLGLSVPGAGGGRGDARGEPPPDGGDWRLPGKDKARV